MNEITIGDKVFISSKRAAEITGYAKDYVGQLCREGHVEAKMVGRSWYVYEPSIRAHRFGEVESHQVAESEESPVTEAEDVSEPIAEAVPEPISWNQPTYTPEEPEFIPELTVSSTPINLIPEVQENEESLSDMQLAWKEWFSRKQEAVQEAPEASVVEEEVEEEEGLEEVEPIDEDYEEDVEEEVVDIPIHRLHEEVVEAPVQQERRDMDMMIPVRHIAPVYVAREPEARIVEERVIRKSSVRPKRSGTNAPTIAALVSVSLIAVVIAVIGSGIADIYLHSIAGSNPVVKYLVGDSTYYRQ